jgi:hypothetical protein
MTVFISAVVGIASALLTIVLTPTLQHHFWTRQRQAERQLAVIDEVGKLLGEYLYQCQEDYAAALAEQRVVGVDNLFGVRFFPALLAIDGQIRALFSEETVQVYLKIRSLIPIGTPKHTWQELYVEFSQRRTRALQALYKEVGIPAPSLGAYPQMTFAPLLQSWSAWIRGHVARLRLPSPGKRKPRTHDDLG